MRRNASQILFLVLILFLFCSPTQAKEKQAEYAEGELIFARSVLPMMKAKCFSCHGLDNSDIRGELNMMTRSQLLKGGESEEPSLVPGQPEESPLYLAATRESYWSAMPPKENDALDEQQLAGLKRWIELGADWPSEDRIEEIKVAFEQQWNAAGGVQVPTSGGLDADWTLRRYEPENLWAYQPLWTDSDNKYGKGSAAIDQFINEKLAAVDLSPAPLADRLTLIRRATYDLTGLPPTPKEIAQFLQDPDDEQTAFAKVIDRLLASPHYGEKWAQHWLDVTRYADSSGFANDFDRGNAWRYRDYVVRAFNDDKPYPEFVKEQIAGDEMDSTDPENLVAVGFLRMGPWELTGMEVAKVARQRFLDDATDSIGQVFLGHMLQCARCHDHKFDPVPTRDYYSIQAALATTQLAERKAPFLDEENVTGFELEQKLLREREQNYNREMAKLNPKNVAGARVWLDEQGLDLQPFEQALLESNGSYDQARNKMRKMDIPEDQIPPKNVGFEPLDYGLERFYRKGKARLSWQKERYQPFAFSVYSGKTPTLKNVQSPLRIPQNSEQGELEDSTILTGGDPFSPAAQVVPGLLSAVVGVNAVTLPADYVLDEKQVELFPETKQAPIQGRRLQLAEWIVSEQNPLTPRVMANRLWNGHFGRGIAGNPNNFGATGKRPTHPKLLDWLAGQFCEQGWSVKQMHRLIMLSETYRRASSHPDPVQWAKADPNQELYAAFQPRRLRAEEIRDSMLSVSGELNPEIGGVPIRPEINLEAALQPRMVMGTFAESWQPSPLPEQRHRRTLYALKYRGLRDPFLEVFNAPSPDLSMENRDTSTVTPQVFALFNGEATYGRALAMANRVYNDEGLQDDEKALGRLYQLAYGRKPTAVELQICLQHWQQMTEQHQSVELNPTEFPASVKREAVEENTGVRFEFSETLEVSDIFEPDLHPEEVSAQVRGLAEVCLILLNSNEFVYVY